MMATTYYCAFCACSVSSSHAGFLSSSTLHLITELEDPHQRMVATDAISAVDRMECTVNDVRHAVC